MKKILIIILIAVLGFALRVGNIKNNPPGLTVDEISIGYNAYSILKTGRDEYGVYLPFNFRSLGDYKPPFYIYLTAVSEYFFGLNEFSVRFPSILFGTLSIFLVYLLIKKLTENSTIGVIGALLFSISPWHVFYSRMASEAIVALFLVILGFVFLIYSEKIKIRYLIISAFFLALSAYTYHSEKVFTPLLVAISPLFFGRKNIKSFLYFLFSYLLFFCPILYSTIFGSGLARAKMTYLGDDMEFLRVIYHEKDYWLLLFFHWLRKYLSFFSFGYIFFDGLDVLNGYLKLGLLYLFETPAFIFGLVVLIKKRSSTRKLIILWFLLGILPASITLGEYHPIRLLIILPVFVFVSSVGMFYLYKKIGRSLILIPMFLLIFWNIFWVPLVLIVHFPIQKGEAYLEGTKEAIEYVIENESKYDQVIIDPRMGIVGPYIRTVPHLYYLFYKQQDPNLYIGKWKEDSEGYKYGKIVIREIVWTYDQHKKNVLLVGSPWSYRLEDVKEHEILKRIYMKDGHLVYLVISPRDH